MMRKSSPTSLNLPGMTILFLKGQQRIQVRYSKKLQFFNYLYSSYLLDFSIYSMYLMRVLRIFKKSLLQSVVSISTLLSFMIFRNLTIEGTVDSIKPYYQDVLQLTVSIQKAFSSLNPDTNSNALRSTPSSES